MTLYAAIGGMQLKRWTAYFTVIGPTLRVLLQAKKAKGCVHADMFKNGDVYFAVSVWNDRAAMRSFAGSGLHASLAKMAMKTMSMFFNHTHEFDAVPSREEMVAEWQAEMKRRDGRGSVGQLRT